MRDKDKSKKVVKFSLDNSKQQKRSIPMNSKANSNSNSNSSSIKGKKTEKSTRTVIERKGAKLSYQTEAENIEDSKESSFDDDSLPMKSHKDELEQLREKDPEFYNFLKENDDQLLKFDDEDESEEDENELDREIANVMDGEFDGEDGKDYRENKTKEITKDLLENTISATEKGSFADLQRLMAMFRVACNPNLNDDEDFDGVMSADRKAPYLINSPQIFEQVMTCTINTMHKAWAKHLEIKGPPFKKADLENMKQHRRWKKIQIMVLMFFKLVLQTLRSLVSSSEKHRPVALFLLDGIQHYLPFLSPLPRLTKTTVKVLTSVWIGHVNAIEAVDGNNNDVRGLSFLRLRQLALQIPGVATEECFRAMYLYFARSCKTFTEGNMSNILYLSKCIVEMLRLDVAMAYQQAFLYIRQLALHLRAAYMKKGEVAMKPIKSWQYMNCIRLWMLVICAMPSEELGLGALAYPLSQIIFGVMSLLPSQYYIPMRLHLISWLQQLAVNCSIFIPTSLLLCEVLEYAEMFAKPSPSTDAPPNLRYMLALPPNSWGKVSVREAVLQDSLRLLRADVEIYRFHVGLPEYAYLPQKKLRSFIKRTRVSKQRDLVRVVSSFIQSAVDESKLLRASLSTSPGETEEFEALLPEGASRAKERWAKVVSGKLSPKQKTFSAPSQTKNALVKDDTSSSSSDSENSEDSEAEDDDDDDDEEEQDDHSVDSSAAETVDLNDSKTNGADIFTLKDSVQPMDWD